MYNGDRMRKQTLVDYGFRLPSALDNRPLKFDEFNEKINQVIYVSATPGDYELELCNNHPVEQLIRPTGLLDPLIEVKPSEGQVDNLIEEINERIKKNERVLVTTLTIRMAEELTDYLKNVGINLLREGIDLPEVSLIAIMDANKQGFLRSYRSLIQIIGRCARNSEGKVIMYADYISDAMDQAMKETSRRRQSQDEVNKEHNRIPKTIIKEIHEIISNEDDKIVEKDKQMTKQDKAKLIINIENEMKDAAKNLDFERAMELRDILFEMKSQE